MSEKRFSKSEAIRFGWKTVNDNLGFFILLTLILLGITVIPSFFAEYTKKTMPLVSMVMRIAANIISILMTPGLIKIYLDFCDGKQGRFEDIFAYSHLFFRYLGGSILGTLAVIGGFICLIVPGLILMVKLEFFGYFLVDQNTGVVESLKKSYAITKGLWGELFILGFLLILINIAGLLCLLIGLFVTVPTTALAMAYVYRKLVSQEQLIPVPAKLIE